MKASKREVPRIPMPSVNSETTCTACSIETRRLPNGLEAVSDVTFSQTLHFSR